MLSGAKVRLLFITSIMALLLGMTAFSPGAFAQEGNRKVKSKVEPAYPQLAKQMHITGVVRVEVVVAPAGTVKSTKVLGGHPLLANAAEDAAKKWKFEPGPAETTMTLVFDFKPNE